jgi:integrase
MMRRAMSWGWVQSNPVALAHKPKKPRRSKVQPPELADVEAARSALELLADKTFVSLVYLGGLRPGEVMGLRWGDVTDTHIRVRRAVSIDEVGPAKTGDRVVLMSHVLAQDLTTWREFASSPFVRVSTAQAGPLLPAEGGGHMTEVEYRAVRHRLKRACESVGVERFTMYSLRHLRASMLIKSGMDVVEAAQELGHDPTMTLNTYSHVLREWKGKPPISVDDEVRRARRGFRSLKAVGS